MNKEIRDKLAKRKNMSSKERVNEVLSAYRESVGKKDPKSQASFAVLNRNMAIRLGYSNVMVLWEKAGSPDKKGLQKFTINNIKKYQQVLRKTIASGKMDANEAIIMLDGSHGKGKKNYQVLNDSCNTNTKIRICCLEKMREEYSVYKGNSIECCCGVFRKLADGRIGIGTGLYNLVHDELKLNVDLKKRLFDRLAKEQSSKK